MFNNVFWYDDQDEHNNLDQIGKLKAKNCFSS